MEVDMKLDDSMKNGEDKTLAGLTNTSLDDSLPKINPVKWTVRKYSYFLTVHNNNILILTGLLNSYLKSYKKSSFT